MSDILDITPTPRILRTLGDIPFDVWQCLAELADNSLDAFRDVVKSGAEISDARLDILWSKEDTLSQNREVIIQDNGPGMSLATLQNAARAGYSNNDPVNNLGLFGMGFNISTARLGEETIFLSTTKGEKEWSGIVIDFAELIEKGSFGARIIKEPKSDVSESGTKIIVRRLRDGIYSDLKSKETAIRRRLEVIYSDILDKDNVEIRLQGKALRPHRHCVWGESRFVMYKGAKIHAVQEIDIDLGEAYFDQGKNRYLSELEIDGLDDKSAAKSSIIKRPRRLKGWIGIQRYSDTSDFGIDFIRNGRKILIGDKSLFGYENPDTGTRIMEYPVELASTVGGRIVGELHVDYLIPTYQKNGFDTSNLAWKMTVDAIRGAGPILPKQRQALGYSGDNQSPLGILANSYRRSDPGTKCLALRRDNARSFLAEFRKGNPDYQNDDKWYKALQEEDKARGGESEATSVPVDQGDAPSDDFDSYLPSSDQTPAATPTAVAPTPPKEEAPITSEKGELMVRCEKQVSLSGKFSYDPKKAGFEVKAWKLKSGHIHNLGKRVPAMIFQDGIDVDFFYDETHPLLEEYPITPKQVLIQVLAERFSARDATVPLQEAFWGLVDGHLMDERIHAMSLRESAEATISQIRDVLPSLLAHRIGKCLELIKGSATESDALAQTLLEKAPDLFTSFQDEGADAAKVLSYVSEDSVISLISAFPEEFMDGKVFVLPYTKINLSDPVATEKLRRASVDKIISYLKDIKMLLKGTSKPNKAELIRYANTLKILRDRLV